MTIPAQINLARPLAAPRLRAVLLAGIAAATLAACDQPLDWDLRNLGGDGLDTTSAAQNLPDRPTPDARGVISYPTYQVVVAQRNDTVRSVATRLGTDADALAQYNGLTPDTALRANEIIALPTNIATSTAIPEGTTGGGINVTTLASNAIDRAAPQNGSGISAITPSTAATAQPFTAEPVRHLVGRGETVYSISRLYNVPVRTISEWNSLPADLSVREGQYLLIPVASSSVPDPTTINTPPGQGSPIAPPPSAATPTPATTAAPATSAPPATPDIGQSQAAASSAPLIYPVQGSVIRAYARGRNEGIDIAAPAGTAVKAAAAGVVAAVTRDTNGVAVVVIRHDNNLLTVYTNLDNLTVEKDQRVTQGQTIGKVKSASTSFLHFEVREGLESVDPVDYLP